MAILTNWYTMDNKLGVNLNKVISSVTITSNPSQPEYPGIPHNLGDRVQGNNGSEWMFVQASATVSCFNLVQIGVGFKAENLVIASANSASLAYVYGVAEFQVRGSVTVGNANGGVCNAGDFFWALMKANGGVRVNLSSSISAAIGSRLYVQTSGTPGWVTTSATLNRFIGMVAQASAVGADNGVPAALEVAFFTYPFPGTAVSVPAVSLTA